MSQVLLPHPDLIAKSRGRPWSLAEVSETLAVGATVGLAAAGSMAMNGPLNFAVFWPANGVLLGFLLTAPRSRWHRFLAAGFAASIIVHFMYGYPFRPTLAVSIANVVEVLIAAWPFYRAGDLPPDLTQPRTLVRFTYLALLAPLVSGLVAVGFEGAFMPEVGRLSLLRGWWAGDALGLVLTTPLMLAILRYESLELFRWKKLPETVCVLTALVMPNLLLTRPGRFPLLFLDFPLLVLVVFRLGLPGAAIGVILMSIPITRYAMNGVGLFALAEYATKDMRVLILQCFFFVALVMVYLMSLVLEERRRLVLELQGSEERYRGMAEHSWDIILRTNVRGLHEYVSPSVLETTGWAPEDLVNRPFTDRVHPDDKKSVEATLDKLMDGEDKQVLVFRVERKHGGYLWMEAKARVVRDKGGNAAREVVTVMRDVSARVVREVAMKAAFERAEARALTDALTGLTNRRGFDESLEAAWKACREQDSPLSILMIDADRFKVYNDTYGHAAGDECLRRIARVIQSCVRLRGDTAARYGGEEFSVVLPNATSEVAQSIAERVRETVNCLSLPHEKDPGPRITVSIGVATATASLQPAMTGAELLRDADAALYQAKREGRNCVRCTPHG